MSRPESGLDCLIYIDCLIYSDLREGLLPALPAPLLLPAPVPGFRVRCEDRLGTGPPRARTEVIHVGLGYWAISGSIHPEGDPARGE